MKALLLALGLGFAALPAQAEIAQKFGSIEIHYNAISTDDLLPDIARAYNIARSKTRGLVTLSVLKKNELGGLSPVPAKITMYVTNQNRQLANIDIREVNETSAIYYLGEFRMARPDTLRFTATVETAGEPRREITFDQRFYK